MIPDGTNKEQQRGRDTMNCYTIYPLNLGTINRDVSAMSYQKNPGIRQDYPVLAWYVTDGNRKALVDTGGEPATGTNRAPYTQTKEQKIDEALRSLGVHPDEIQYVFLTHLHWDHAGSNTLFENAEFFVQKRELECAIVPPYSQENSYVIQEIVKTKYTVLNGDVEDILPGISIIQTPGHTPGSQSVLIQGKQSIYAIVGDLFSTRANWEAKPPIVNGWLTSMDDYALSVKKLSGIENLLLMASHDAAVLENSKYE